VPAGAERGAQKMSSVGSAPPQGNPSAPIRSETWTDNLGRKGEERLAHVKELIEVGLGQRTPHFGQSNISLRHFDDHLVITWEAEGNYGRAWTAWSNAEVRAAYKAMLEKKQQALAADEKLRTAQANEYSARKTGSHAAKTREVGQEEEKSKDAWNKYYEAQHTYEGKYETAYKDAPASQKRLTFEIWLVYNINGGLAQNLPERVAEAFDVDLSNEPVNHFLRMQRSNYPRGETERPSKVRPPYPTDAAAANAILEDIFLPKPRTHASSITAIFRDCAKGVAWGLLFIAALGGAVLGYSLWNLRFELTTEQTLLEAINGAISRLEELAGKEGQDIGGLEQAKGALDGAVLDVEGKINDLDDQIRGLNNQLTLTFKRQGLDAPPCWGVGQPPNDRRVRYLFKVELREHDAEPIRVTRVRNAPSESIARGPFAGTTIGANYSSSFEQPAAGFPFGNWISAKDFSNRIAGPVNNVYAARDAANSCRHYVRLCDHSYQDKSAASYKALLGLVGGTFYYYRPKSCGQAPPRD